MRKVLRDKEYDYGTVGEETPFRDSLTGKKLFVGDVVDKISDEGLHHGKSFVVKTDEYGCFIMGIQGCCNPKTGYIDGLSVKLIKNYQSIEVGDKYDCITVERQFNNNIKESVVVDKKREFIVGDKVKVIKEPGYGASAEIGDTAVIIDIDNSSSCQIKLDGETDKQWVFISSLELIEAAKDVQKLKIITEGTTTTVKIKGGKTGVAKLYYKDTFNKGFGIVQALGAALDIDLVKEVLKVVKSYEVEDKPTKEEIKEFADRTAFKYKIFEVGDLVKSNEKGNDGRYCITNSLMQKAEVIKVETDRILIKVLEHEEVGRVGSSHWVEPECFELVKEDSKFEIGCKVKIPKTKQGREGNGQSYCVNAAKEKGQDYLFLIRVALGIGKKLYVLSENKVGTGDYFNIEDLELYEEEAKVKFKIGDIIRGTSKKFYPITDTRMTRAEVVPCKLDNRIRVKILDHTEEGFIDNEYNVEPEYFELVERTSEFVIGDTSTIKITKKDTNEVVFEGNLYGALNLNILN